MSTDSVKSVEPQVADMFNNQLKQYGIDYKLEQETLNEQIDNALLKYISKGGGGGGNRPDVKALVTDKYGKHYPVIIEYKGYEDKLVKFDENGIVENLGKNNTQNFSNIKNYAVNGAVHYANAILHYTNYERVIAIGITGYSDNNKLKTKIGVYYVSKDNFGLGQEVDKYDNLSFLSKEHFGSFIDKINNLNLSEEEKENLKFKREGEIYKAILDLNNEIFNKSNNQHKNWSETERLYLVVATIIATLGVPESAKNRNTVSPLETRDLQSLKEKGKRDGDIILQKIDAFLDSREQIPKAKKELILNELKKVLSDDSKNEPINGESQIRQFFTKIVDDIGIYYKIGITTDFTGMLFNEMYRWLGFTEDKLNDVVLTPSYVSRLLVKLAHVNMDSYVWDFACGSGGLLIAAMNEMLNDADKKLANKPDECAKKKISIKLNQILGIEILQSVYMLAILNMIMMGDGSSNLLHKNSLTDFDGKYGFREVGEKFPATAFVLNPPYSASGCGMIFVERALSLMNSGGYAAIIIMSSAGSGKATYYNKEILKRNTLLASIKMPIDLFVGKSSVQTYVYVFKVGEEHTIKDNVKFIDFSNDGYTRTARKKSSVNLRDTDHAKERYQELIDLVTAENYNLDDLKYLKDKVYIGKIDVNNGADWNQSVPIDIKPTLSDFKKTVGDYLSWEVSNILKNRSEDDSLGK